jgi:hypothetical protein
VCSSSWIGGAHIGHGRAPGQDSVAVIPDLSARAASSTAHSFAGRRRPHYSLGGIVLLVISPNSHSTLTSRALDIMSNSSTKIRRVPASISYTVGRLIPKSLAKSALLILFDCRNEAMRRAISFRCSVVLMPLTDKSGNFWSIEIQRRPPVSRKLLSE